MKKNNFWTTRNIALMGMLGAMGALLMYLELPLTFLAPNFYKLDFSEIPVMVGTFSLGPVAGAVIEAVNESVITSMLAADTVTGRAGHTRRSLREFAGRVAGLPAMVSA